MVVVGNFFNSRDCKSAIVAKMGVMELMTVEGSAFDCELNGGNAEMGDT